MCLHEQICMTCSVYQMAQSLVFNLVLIKYLYITTLFRVGVNILFYVITYYMNCRYRGGYHVCQPCWAPDIFPSSNEGSSSGWRHREQLLFGERHAAIIMATSMKVDQASSKCQLRKVIYRIHFTFFTYRWFDKQEVY